MPTPHIAASDLDVVDLHYSSPIPLYHQLTRGLEQLACTRPDLAGARLPSEADLARRFHVSRPTIRHALAELSTKGLIDRQRGRGTTITPLGTTRARAAGR